MRNRVLFFAEFARQLFVVDEPLDLLRAYATLYYLNTVSKKKNVSPYDLLTASQTQELVSAMFGLNVCRNYLRTAFCEKGLSALCKNVGSLPAEAFVHYVLPGVVTEEEKVFNLLDQTESNAMEKALLILLAKNMWRRQCGEPVLVDGYEARAHQKIEKQLFEKIVLSANCYEYSFRTSVRKAAREAHLALEGYGLSSEHQISIYGQVRETLVGDWLGRKIKWADITNDYAAYIRAALAKNSHIDIFDLDDAVNAVAVNLGKIERPTDFLAAVLVNGKNDDSKIENNYVRAKFLEGVSKSDTLLVINPSPSFVSEYPKELLKKTTFAVASSAAARVLNNEFLEAVFLGIEDFLGDSKEATNCCYTRVLLLMREIDRRDGREIVETVKRTMTTEGTLYALVPEAEIVGEKKETRYLNSFFSVVSLDILPPKAINSAPKKKVFVTAKNITEETSIAVTKYKWHYANEKIFLQKESELPVFIDPSYLTTAKSIGQVYSDKCSELSQKRKRKMATAFQFSSEITFWYTKSKAKGKKKEKVEAYVCELPTEQQKKRSKQPRGKQIEGAYASTTLWGIHWELESWLYNALPFIKNIHDGVKKAFSKDDSLLRSGGASLRTLWYLQCPTDKKIAKDEIKLFFSAVGDVSLASSEETYKIAMKEYCGNMPIDEQSRLWNILSRVVQFCVTNGYIKKNHIQKIADDYREKRDTAIDEVRAAIAKKTFHHKEEYQLLSTAVKYIGEGKAEYIAVPVRLFTGLEPVVIAALTWGDIYKIPGTSIHQLWVFQKMGDGNLPVFFSHREDYRRIPIHPQLDVILEERRTQIKRMGVSEKEIKKLQIVASDDQVLNRPNAKTTARNIRSLSRDIIENLGIQERMVAMPDKFRGTTETDFASYRGDIFRGDFRYRGNEVCGFTEAESRYLLGNQQTTPFGRNYGDFANDFAQLKIYLKLCRWIIKDRHKLFLPQIERISNGVKVVEENERSGVLLEMQVCRSGEPFRINAHCTHGLHISAWKIKKGAIGDDYD